MVSFTLACCSGHAWLMDLHPGYQWYQVPGKYQMILVQIRDDDVDTLLPFVAYSLRFISLAD